MKRTLAFMLALLLAFGCLAACGADQPETESTQGTTQNLAPNEDLDMNENNGGNMFDLPDFTIGTVPPEDETTDGTDTTEPATVAPLEEEFSPVVGNTLKAEAGEKISYVMVYNPALYTEENPQILGTGKLSDQIQIDLNRADDLTNPEKVPFDQFNLGSDVLDKINLEGGKADGLVQFYNKGDKQAFYCGSADNVDIRTEMLFTCAYAGNHANIWVYETLDTALIDKLGKVFDETIYDECVNRFGEPRFGQVVNILLYSFNGDPNTVGFFHPLDLFSFTEASDQEALYYGMNRDHNVININALWMDREDTLISTLAHELQHLQCFTGYFSAGNNCDVWFNEAMSGYIEEALYPGIQLSSVECYHTSNRIRNGQSLYNFGTDVTMLTVDIGVYGSMYLYEEYMKNIAGEEFFTKFHENWRNTYAPMTTIQGICSAISPELYAQIDDMVYYPTSMQFASYDEEWMSKLTLLFYLSTFTKDPSTPEQYREILLPYLLYDSLMEAQIEGGGRIILATKNGTFQIPQDADPGLIFVGLNKDLEIVTNLACS